MKGERKNKIIILSRMLILFLNYLQLQLIIEWVLKVDILLIFLLYLKVLGISYLVVQSSLEFCKTNYCD